MYTTNPKYLQNLCRVCLKTEYFAPKRSDGIGEHGGAPVENNSLLCPMLCKLFFSFTTLDVRQEVKDFPKHLCPMCLSKLRDYEDFRDEALRSTKRLHDMINITNEMYEVKMETKEETIKSELTNAEYADEIKSETVTREETVLELENNSCNEDIANDTLLLPELVHSPINIKTDPNFEATETHFTLPFYGQLDEPHRNQLYETNNSEDDGNDEELLLRNGASDNSNPSTGSANETIAKQVKLEMTKARCDMCNKTFRNKIYLDAHVLGTHFGQEKPYQCKNCSVAFKIYRDLTLHILTNHTDQIKEVVPRNRRIEHSGYNCQICGHSYVSSRTLTEHLKRHNEIKDHVCNECGVTKVTRNELNNHMRVHKTNPEKFQCPRCPQEFSTKKTVSRHIEVVHEGLKRFPCNFCIRRFSTRYSQVRHERLHRGERPFKCNMCQKGFAQKEGLVTHMQTHDKNLRKHVCSYCSQRFITLKNLKNHEKRHLGDNPQ